MEESVFDIPLLLDEISKYLSESDLRACIRVSRIWSARFIPILWRTVDFSSRNLIYNLNTFSKGQTHVRTIKIRSLWFFEGIVSSYGHKHIFYFHFPNLRSLQWTFDFVGCQDPMSINLALDFFKDHPTLQDISFGFEIITRELIIILDKSNLPALRSFGLIGSTNIKDDSSVQQLIRACARLETLNITIDRYEDHHEEPNIDLYQERKAIMEDMPTTRLRCLSIDLRCPSQEAVTLVPLLRKSPLLQELRIHFSPGNDMSRSIATILRDEGCCPELRTLSIMQDKITDSELAELINACTSHTSLSGNHRSSLITTTSNKVHRNLKDLTIASKNYGPLTINSLAQNCAQNLVALNIVECEYVHFSDFIAIVSNLSGLKKLVVDKIYLVSRFQRGTNALINALEIPWVCRDLMYLGFDLSWEMKIYSYDDSDTEDDDNTDDMIDLANFRDRALGCFFDRVGELKNLRHISYDGRYIPLLSRSGNENELSYLDRLRDLKKIQTLRVDRTILGVKEAAWLILHWPNLSQISGLWRKHADDCPCKTRFILICKRPFEQGEGITVLKAAKPWIIVE